MVLCAVYHFIWLLFPRMENEAGMQIGPTYVFSLLKDCFSGSRLNFQTSDFPWIVNHWLILTTIVYYSMQKFYDLCSTWLLMHNVTFSKLHPPLAELRSEKCRSEICTVLMRLDHYFLFPKMSKAKNVRTKFVRRVNLDILFSIMNFQAKNLFKWL